jgi:aquaporin Z
MTDETPLNHKLAAEAIGTFLLVLFGVGAAVTTGADVTSTGLAFGFAVILGAFAFGRISGAHFNPAVSIGVAISGRMTWLEAVRYIVAQFVGAIVGALVLFITVKSLPGYSIDKNGLGADAFGDGHIKLWGALFVELVLTLVFVFVIMAVTDDRMPFKGVAPVAIGLTLTAVHFVGIPLTGTSVNPARALGPALFAGGHALGQVWLFILAPAVGGALAGLAYPALFGRTEEPLPGSGLDLSKMSPPARLPQGPTKDLTSEGAVMPLNDPTGMHPHFPPAPPAPPAPTTAMPTMPAPPAPGMPGAPGAPGVFDAPAAPVPPPYQAAPPAPAPPAPYQPAPPAPADPLEQTVSRPLDPQPDPSTTAEVPSWQQPVAPGGEGELPVYEHDGWRWDYARQEWVPIEPEGR